MRQEDVTDQATLEEKYYKLIKDFLYNIFMKEKWKSCPRDIKSSYEVSNLGRVRNINTGFILNQKTMPTGYKSVQLFLNSERKWPSVHSLVAGAFIGRRPIFIILVKGEVKEERAQINHKDLDKSNNRWDNLEYVTQSNNWKHAYSRGVVMGNIKLCDDDVIKMHKLYNTGKYTYVKIGEIFNVTGRNVSLVLNGKTKMWKHLCI